MVTRKIRIAAIVAAVAMTLLIASRRSAEDPKMPPTTGNAMFPDGVTHDFGKVTRGTDLKHAFRIVNTSKQPLRIAYIQSEVPLRGRSRKDLLQPGEETSLEVIVETDYLVGSQTQQLFLVTENLEGRGGALTTFSVSSDTQINYFMEAARQAFGAPSYGPPSVPPPTPAGSLAPPQGAFGEAVEAVRQAFGAPPSYGFASPPPTPAEPSVLSPNKGPAIDNPKKARKGMAALGVDGHAQVPLPREEKK